MPGDGSGGAMVVPEGTPENGLFKFLHLLMHIKICGTLIVSMVWISEVSTFICSSLVICVIPVKEE